jgi:hypothetical protein
MLCVRVRGELQVRIRQLSALTSRIAACCRFDSRPAVKF